MKKLFSLMLVALMALPMSAQFVRDGNTYIVDGQTMKKGAFALYMQSNAQANLSAQFQNGLNLSKTGWGLFGGGLGLDLIGSIVSVSGLFSSSAAVVTAGSIMSYLGGAITISGIVCLGVGYSRMHNAADFYGVEHNKKRNSQAFLSLQAGQNGLGLALNF